MNMLGTRVKPKTVRALVTGAGSGIGACYAHKLAELGYDLTIVSRDRQKLEDLAARIRRETKVDVEVLPRDLSTAAAAEDLCRRLARDATIEIVVNSAGSGQFGAVTELDDAKLRAEVDLNVVSVHRITMAAARAMRARGRGAIVNVASLSGFISQPYLSTYAGTKAFLENFSESLSEELRGTGVVVQALCPGFTRTNIFAAAEADVSTVPWFMWLKPETVVRASIAALRQGRAICVPSIRYKLVYWTQKLGPRWVSRRMMGFVLGRVKKLPLDKQDPTSAPNTGPAANTASATNTENGAPPNSGDAPRTVPNQPLEIVR
jgi:uncharacterized protein